MSVFSRTACRLVLDCSHLTAIRCGATLICNRASGASVSIWCNGRCCVDLTKRHASSTCSSSRSVNKSLVNVMIPLEYHTKLTCYVTMTRFLALTSHEPSRVEGVNSQCGEHFLA
jgi:hypothetical protein